MWLSWCMGIGTKSTTLHTLMDPYVAEKYDYVEIRSPCVVALVLRLLWLHFLKTKWTWKGPSLRSSMSICRVSISEAPHSRVLNQYFDHRKRPPIDFIMALICFTLMLMYKRYLLKIVLRERWRFAFNIIKLVLISLLQVSIVSYFHLSNSWNAFSCS